MKDNRGFTLLEILTTIVILGIVLTVFFQFFTFSQRATTSNEERLVAVNHAEKVLERMVQSEEGEVYREDIRNHPNFSNKTQTIEIFCEREECKKKYSFTNKERNYVIKLVASPEHHEIGLYTVKVQVYEKGNEEDLICEVKGLVEL